MRREGVIAVGMYSASGRAVQAGRKHCHWALKANVFRQLDAISVRDTKFFQSKAAVCHKCYCFSTPESGQSSLPPTQSSSRSSAEN